MNFSDNYIWSLVNKYGNKKIKINGKFGKVKEFFTRNQQNYSTPACMYTYLQQIKTEDFVKIR